MVETIQPSANFNFVLRSMFSVEAAQTVFGEVSCRIVISGSLSQTLHAPLYYNETVTLPLLL